MEHAVHAIGQMAQTGRVENIAFHRTGPEALQPRGGDRRSGQGHDLVSLPDEVPDN